MKKDHIKLEDVLFRRTFKYADLQSKLPKLVETYKKKKNLSEEEAKQKVLELNQYDPTGSLGVYTPWLVKQEISGNLIFPEDGDKVKEALTFFEKIKKKPIDIPKDIFQYKTYGDLAKTLEPYKEKPLSKKEEEKLKIQQGLEKIYDDGTYQVIKITTPEASHDFRYSRGAIHWCTKDISYAKEYLSQGPLYVFMKNGKPIAQLHKETKSFMDFYDTPVSKELYQELYPILKKLNLEIPKFTYRYIKLSPEQINKTIEKGEDLYYLYTHQKLSPEQINKTIEKGEDLGALYVNQKLTSEQIGKAIEIEKGEDLYYLYAYQKLSPENIDKAIEKGEDLSYLYAYQKLSPENIDKAIEKGEDLSYLYTYQKLSPENIDKAIEKGEDIDYLYVYQKLTPEQKEKIKKIFPKYAKTLLAKPENHKIKLIYDVKKEKFYKPGEFLEERSKQSSIENPETKEEIINWVFQKDPEFKIIPKGKYLGVEPAHYCEKNSIKQKNLYPVYQGYLIFFSPDYEKYTAVPHWFNTNNGKVFEFTNLSPINWDSTIYIGKPAAEKEIEEMKKHASFKEDLLKSRNLKFIENPLFVDNSGNYYYHFTRYPYIDSIFNLGLIAGKEKGQLESDIVWAIDMPLETLLEQYSGKNPLIVIKTNIEPKRYSTTSAITLGTNIPSSDIMGVIVPKNKRKFSNINPDLRKMLVKKIRKKEYKIGKRPLDLYICRIDEINKKDFLNKYDSLYDIMEDKWIKKPKTIDINKYDREEVINRGKEKALEWAKKFDLEIGDIKRHIKDYEQIKKYLKDLPIKEKQKFKKEIDKILEEIEKDIRDMVEEKEDIVDERHKSFNIDFTPDFTDFYLSLNWNDTNIAFKLIQKWNYLTLAKELDKLLDDDKITEEEVKEVDKIIKNSNLTININSLSNKDEFLKDYKKYRSLKGKKRTKTEESEFDKLLKKFKEQFNISVNQEINIRPIDSTSLSIELTPKEVVDKYKENIKEEPLYNKVDIKSSKRDKLKKMIKKDPLLLESMIGNADVFYPIQQPTKEKIDKFVDSIPDSILDDLYEYENGYLKLANKSLLLRFLKFLKTYYKDLDKETFREALYDFYNYIGPFDVDQLQKELENLKGGLNAR